MARKSARPDSGIDEILLVGLVEIALTVRRGKKTVRVWIDDKNLPAFKVDGKGPWCILHGDLIDWFENEAKTWKKKADA